MRKGVAEENPLLLRPHREEESGRLGRHREGVSGGGHGKGRL